MADMPFFVDLLHRGVDHLANAKSGEVVALDAPTQDVGESLALLFVDELIDGAKIAADRAHVDVDAVECLHLDALGGASGFAGSRRSGVLAFGERGRLHTSGWGGVEIWRGSRGMANPGAPATAFSPRSADLAHALGDVEGACTNPSGSRCPPPRRKPPRSPPR